MAGGGNATPDASDGATDAASMGLVGTWKGYVENFKFKDDTDAVLLVITSEAGAGRITFGNSPAPPPQPIPTSATRRTSSPWAQVAARRSRVPTQGSHLRWSSRRVVAIGCSSMSRSTSFTRIGANYRRRSSTKPMPGHNTIARTIGASMEGPTGCAQPDPKTMMNVPIDCEKLRLCQSSGTCACTAQGCTANLDAGLHVDLTVAGSKASGSARNLDQDLHNVHFTKQ